MSGIPEAMPGDFGLTQIHGFSGFGVRCGQWLMGDGFLDFEHAFLVLDHNQIIEAEPGGARIVDIDEYAPDSGYTVQYSQWPLTRQQRLDIVAAGRKCEGVPYAWLDYFAIAEHHFDMNIWFGNGSLREYIEGTGHMICSQLVDWCYAQADLHMFQDKRWAGYVKPGDLWQVRNGPIVD